MVAFILAILIGVAVLAAVFDIDMPVLSVVVGLWLGGGAFIISAVVLNLLFSWPMHKTFTTEHVKLAALQDGSSTSGVFFLGSGSINSQPTYTYYRQAGAGAKLEQTDATNVVVFEDTTTPYIVQQTGCRTSIKWLANCLSDERVTEIHVPKGTIKRNFVLDAKGDNTNE